MTITVEAWKLKRAIGRVKYAAGDRKTLGGSIALSYRNPGSYAQVGGHCGRTIELAGGRLSVWATDGRSLAGAGIHTKRYTSTVETSHDPAYVQPCGARADALGALPYYAWRHILRTSPYDTVTLHLRPASEPWVVTAAEVNGVAAASAAETAVIPPILKVFPNSGRQIVDCRPWVDALSKDSGIVHVAPSTSLGLRLAFGQNYGQRHFHGARLWRALKSFGRSELKEMAVETEGHSPDRARPIVLWGNWSVAVVAGMSWSSIINGEWND